MLTAFMMGVVGQSSANPASIAGEIVGSLLVVGDLAVISRELLAHSGWTDADPNTLMLGMSVAGFIPVVGDATAGVAKTVIAAADNTGAAQFARRIVADPLSKNTNPAEGGAEVAQNLLDTKTALNNGTTKPSTFTKGIDSPDAMRHNDALLNQHGANSIVFDAINSVTLQAATPGGTPPQAILRQALAQAPSVVQKMGQMPQARANALAATLAGLLGKQAAHANKVDAETLARVLSNPGVHRIASIDELTPEHLERLAGALNDLQDADGFGTLMRRLRHHADLSSQGQTNNLKGAVYELIVAAKIRSGQISFNNQAPQKMLMTSRLIRTTADVPNQTLTTDLDVVYETASGLTEFVQCKATQTPPNLAQLQLWAGKAVQYAKEKNIPLNTVRIRLVTETPLSPTNQVKWREAVSELLGSDVSINLSDVMTVLPVAW